MSAEQAPSLQWHRVADRDELPEGRVKTVTAGHRSLALTHHDGKYGALDNRCPHQGGPLGEGSIENGLLRCPWHGWDYYPLTGKAAGLRRRGRDLPGRGPRRRGLRRRSRRGRPTQRTVSDVMVETMANWGVRRSSAWWATRTSGSPTRCGARRAAGRLSYIGIRHEGAAAFACSAYGKLTGRPAACLTIAGPGRHQPAHRALGRQRRPRAGPGPDRPGRHPGAGPGCLPGGRPAGGLRQGGPVEPDRAPRQQARRADEPGLQERDPEPRCVPPDLPRRGPDAAGRPRMPSRAARRAGWPPARSRRPAEALDEAVDAPREAEAAGHHRRPRRPLRHGGGHRAGRGARTPRSSPPSRARG